MVKSTTSKYKMPAAAILDIRLCEIKKMSVASDWMKIYASNFTELDAGSSYVLLHIVSCALNDL